MPCEFCSGTSRPAHLVSLGSVQRALNRCTACDAVQIGMPFDESDLQRFYEQDYFSARPWQIAKGEVLAQDYERKVQRVQGRAPWRGDALEVGAGFAFFARDFGSHTGLGVDVVEPSRSCRDFIRDRSCARQVFGSLDELGSAGARYQEVFAFHVVEHLQRLSPFLAAIREILAPDGRLWILTPNASSRSFRRFGDGWGWAVPDQHYQFLSQTIPERYYASLGFVVVQCSDVRPARIHFPSAWKSSLDSLTAAVTRRIDATTPRAALPLRAVRRTSMRSARHLRQNTTTANLSSVERVCAGLVRRRPFDELMLVLRRAPVPQNAPSIAVTPGGAA